MPGSAPPLLAQHDRVHVLADYGTTVARAAGSVGPWEPGGISPFQRDAGAALAEREGRLESYGPTIDS